MASSTTQPVDAVMADGDATTTLGKSEEETTMSKPVDPVAEEKKHDESPGDEDGVVATSVLEDTMATKQEPTETAGTAAASSSSSPPTKSSSTSGDNNGQVSPSTTTEAPKQTLSGEAAAAAKSTVAGSVKDKSDSPTTSPNEQDSPLSPGSAASNNNNNNSSSHAYQDDEDSSNDDSSYFADPNNLPSPGEAHRKYSYSSHHSTSKNAKGRESDASLSLSDDSDDEHTHPHGGNNLYGQQAPEVFPQQRITRMHSVGSLVSTSSQNTEEDPALRRELRHVGKERAYHDSHQNSVPSGRISPAQGPLLYPPHSGGHQPFPHGSPPTILPDNRQYQLPQGFPHPQPHQPIMSGQDQWMASANNAPPNGNSGGPGGVPDGSMPYSNGEAPNGHVVVNGGGNNVPKKSSSRRAPARDVVKRKTEKPPIVPNGAGAAAGPAEDHDDGQFTIYWQRWIMLMYMSVLNLLSDWTCYSVAPIALLTQEAFGEVDPEQLVTIFLAANAFASACEPIILSRLGLRRTVLFGSLLLMIGSMVKSGGMPPIIQANLEKGHCETQIYLGFFLVGLSQPLYQCTPALLSASWFPEKERTMATGVALNANQLGIGFAFIFGTLLVADSDDIPSYFGLLSIVSTVAFFGTLFQFDDAPPTPPSDSARVMRGTLEVNLPSVQTILQSIGVGGSADMKRDIDEAMKDTKTKPGSKRSSSGKVRRSGKSAAGKSRSRSGGPPTSARGRSNRGSRSSPDGSEPHAPAPSSAPWDDKVTALVAAPSPMMPGSVGGAPGPGGEEGEGGGERRDQQQQPPPQQQPPVAAGYPYGSAGAPVYPGTIATGVPAGVPPPMPPVGYPGYGPPPQGPPQGVPGYGAYPPPGYPNYQMNYAGYQYPYPPPGQYYQPPQGRGAAGPYSYQQHGRPDQAMYSDPYSVLPPAEGIDAGAEPVLTITPHHLDIDIRDDQIILATRACFARPGFIHSLVTFTVSGIVINTLSTYMDYLVRLNGAGREYTGIIGGSFQVVIMISSLIIGGLTDKSRAYYSVTIGMLVIGAFGLAECGVSLNADRGNDLRVALIVVAALVGPLQPVSTELGVEVVYPLSENTVLVIQQLFSNLLSALFIPVFKELKDIGISEGDGTPEYTFSFYLLICLHAIGTIFVATFNGRYLRYEHELQKKDEKERKRQEAFENASVASMGSFQPSLMSGAEGYDTGDAERQPLVQQHQTQIV